MMPIKDGAMRKQVIAEGSFKKLSISEMDVLKWLADGKRYDEIAEITGLSLVAVQQKSYRIKNKIGAYTSAGVVAMAIRMGIID